MRIVHYFTGYFVIYVPRWWNFFSHIDRSHLPEVRVVVCGYHVTAWRTTCLYGVSDSRASPRLHDGGTSSVSALTARSMRGECGWVAILSPHGALRAYTVFLTAEPRRGSTMVKLLQYQGQTAPPRGASGEGDVLSPHGILCACAMPEWYNHQAIFAGGRFYQQVQN